MRKTIKRTIATTIVHSVNVKMVKGQLSSTDNAPLTMNGEVKEDKALKEVTKAYGNNSLISNIEVHEAEYEISVEDFFKYATKVEKKEDVDSLYPKSMLNAETGE